MSMKITSIKTGGDLRKWRYSFPVPKKREDVAKWSNYSYSQVSKVEQAADDLVPAKLLDALIRNYK